MKRETLNHWIEALESGKYKKGSNFLRSSNDEYCCLGVLCEIEKVPTEIEMLISPRSFGYDGSFSILSYDLKTKFNMFGCAGNHKFDDNMSLASLNDTHDSFEPVIQQLKTNPENYMIIEE
jgi:hypothetical protein